MILFTEDDLAVVLFIIMIGGVVGFAISAVLSIFTKED